MTRDSRTGGRSITVLTGVMVLAAFGASALAFGASYHTAFELEKEHLGHLVDARSEVIRSISALRDSLAPENDSVNLVATIGQMERIHRRLEGFDSTGELALATEEDGTIRFLLSHRGDSLRHPKPVSIGSGLAEPMALALAGQSGTTVGRDYSGQTVVAAFRYLPELDLGIVAKVDLSEVRRPFLEAGALVGLAAIVLVVIGVIVFRRVGDPLLRELERKEERYRVLFEHSPVALYEEDFSEVRSRIVPVAATCGGNFRDYLNANPGFVRECLSLVRITDVNQAAVEMLGVSGKQELLSVLTEGLTPETLDVFVEELAAFAEGKTEFRAETVARNRIRGSLNVSLAVAIAPGAEETWSTVFVALEDITERRRMIEALTASEERFRALTESASEGIIIASENGEIQYLNDSALGIFGYGLEEMVMEPITRLIPDAWRDAHMEAFGSAQSHSDAERRGRVLEVEGLRRDGSVFPVELSLTSWEQGDVRYFGALVRDISERREAEELVERMGQRNQLILDSAGQGVMGVDESGRVTFANPAAARILSTAPTRMIGRECRKVFNLSGALEQESELTPQWLADLSEPTAFELRIVEATGDDPVHVSVVANPVDQAYDGMRAVLVFEDITERKAAETEMRLKAAVLAATANGIIVTDDRGAIEWVNPAFESLTGYTSRDVVGKTPAILKSGEQDADFYRDMWTTIMGGDTWVGELVNRRRDGATYHASLSITPVCDAEGAIHHFVGVTDDVTDRIRASEALRQSESIHREFVENASYGIYRSSPDGRFLSANPAFVRMLGYETEADLLVVPIESFYADPTRREELLGEMQQTGELDDAEVMWRRRDGTPIHLMLNARGVRGDTGDVEMHEVIVQDLTETDELEAQLRLAQKLESVGQLAAGIAHEINTPMQYIGDNVHFLNSAHEDYARLLARYRESRDVLVNEERFKPLVAELLRAEDEADVEYLDENVPEAFARTFDGLKRVTEIVRAMKEFSHPSQREKAAVDINRSIENTLVVARNEYKYVADVETDLGEIPSVQGLEGDLNQVFLNLIVNAAHAIEAGTGGANKGVIRISTRLVDDEVEITVADSGCGIPAAIRDRIFDPFFTTKEVGKGTGQGLAIARSVVVEKHDGCIHVESEEGGGTTFHIRLPVTCETAEELVNA